MFSRCENFRIVGEIVSALRKLPIEIVAHATYIGDFVSTLWKLPIETVAHATYIGENIC